MPPVPKNPTYLFILFLIALLWSGCNSYQKIAKSGDLDLKYSKAKEYFEKKDYSKAIPLLEELITIYKGSRNIDDLYYMYAKSHFEQGDFLIAAFHFKNIYDSYPNSTYAEDALYYNALSYHRMSPHPNLDQEETKKAIANYQLFVNAYPKTEKLEECNNSVRALRRKLETKAFNGANLYYKTGHYKAAATAFSNYMREFPDSPEIEKASFLTIKSYYLYAQNSISAKQIERYLQTIEAYKDFAAQYKNSKLLKEAEALSETSKQQIQKLEQQEAKTKKIKYEH